jgi:hypothetical protein
MNKYGVVITDNGKVVDFLRFSTEEEAEKAYQENKKQMKGVVKVTVDKASEPIVTQIPQRKWLNEYSKYQTVYETPYGIVKSIFKKEMTFEEAKEIGKEYCEIYGYLYIETEEVMLRY